MHGNGIGLERRNPVRTLKNAIMPVPVENPWVEMGEGGVKARMRTPIKWGGIALLFVGMGRGVGMKLEEVFVR